MAEKKKILIVDDEADERDWLSTFFEDSGYDTATAVDGEEGFDKAQKEGIDLITLDISMDNQSGIRMFRNLQENPSTASIPVIMITGVAREFKQYIERARQVHPPDGYFEKPVDRNALLGKVQELIG
ncbi:MAG: response regulator [Candidatus Eiseniibacteriota bacterium]|jgi:CheY-like chemotaxis protein